MISGLEHLLYKAERAGVVQPGEEDAPGGPYRSLPVPKGACRKAGGGLFARACSDNTRGNGSKLKEGRFRLDIRKKFFTVRMARTLAQAAQSSCGCPIPGSAQGQAGRGWGQPGLVEGVPAHGGGWSWVVFKVPCSPHHSVILRCLMNCSVFSSVIRGELALVQLCQCRAELSWVERIQDTIKMHKHPNQGL